MTETIITLGMHFFLRCFRLVMVMTGLCPYTTGNPCDLVHNALKCEGPIYIEHFLVLLSVVTDINFFPSTSQEIRNAVELHADPLLQHCSSNAKHFFMQGLFSLKTVRKQTFARIIDVHNSSTMRHSILNYESIFTLVAVDCTCLMLREPDK